MDTQFSQNKIIKTNQTKLIALDLCVILFFSFPMTFLYGIFSFHPNFHGGDYCIDLLYYSRIFFFFMAVSLFLTGLINPLLFMKLKKLDNENRKIGIIKTMNRIRFFWILANLISFFFIENAYFEDEPCGYLTKLSGAYIYVSYCTIAVAFVVLILICFISCIDNNFNLYKKNDNGEQLKLISS